MLNNSWKILTSTPDTQHGDTNTDIHAPCLEVHTPNECNLVYGLLFSQCGLNVSTSVLQSLSKSKTFWSKVFTITRFTEDIALCLSHCSGVQFLPTCSAVKTSFVVYTTSSHDLLCKEHRFATSATHVRGAVVTRPPVVLLQQWCRLSHSVRRDILFGHFVRVPCVHGESGGSRCKAVSFWSEQFTMAVLAVDIVMVVGAVGAVKSFVTACTSETEFMVLLSQSPDFFRKVHLFSTPGALVPTPKPS